MCAIVCALLQWSGMFLCKLAQSRLNERMDLHVKILNVYMLRLLVLGL